MTTIAFFNNKGGVGKTTLLYHLAWMYAEIGLRTVAVDLDPQSNLTSMFLTEDRLDELWEGPGASQSIVAAVAPLLEEGTGEVAKPHLEVLTRKLALVPGDLGLARMEDELSAQWPNCLEGVAKAFRITAVFNKVIQMAAEQFQADLVLIDVGPNLGALNRCAVITADYVAVPLIPDLFSLQGLRNLGPTLEKWRKSWTKRLDEAPLSVSGLPQGKMKPAGYIVLQHAVRDNRPVKAYGRWAAKIPEAYRKAMSEAPPPPGTTIENDIRCLAQLKHYRSLMPLAMEARKPIFNLKSADGAIGAHIASCAECGVDFRALAIRLAKAAGVGIPTQISTHSDE